MNKSLSAAAVAVAAMSSLTALEVRAEAAFNEDEIAVRRAVEDYFWGRQNGDQDRLARGFQLEGGDMKSVGTENGKDSLRILPLSEFRSRLNKPLEEASNGTILAMDIVDGKMAWVKLNLDSASRTFTDYLLFYKINGEWKLVNKMFTVKMK